MSRAGARELGNFTWTHNELVPQIRDQECVDLQGATDMCLTLETQLSNHGLKDSLNEELKSFIFGCNSICTSGVYRAWSLCKKKGRWFLQMVPLGELEAV